MDFSGLKKMCFRHAIIRFLSNCVAFLIEKIRSDSKGRCICMNEKFMKEKPVFPLIMSMATPMVISMLVNSLYNIVDSFFVAKIGEDAITALSLVYPVQNLVNALAIGFGVGLNAVIAFHLGAGEKRQPIQPPHTDFCSQYSTALSPPQSAFRLCAHSLKCSHSPKT